MSLSRTWISVVLGTVLLLSGQHWAAADDKIVAKIIADWKARQEKTARVHYELEGWEIKTKGSINDGGDPSFPPGSIVPAEDVRLPLRISLKLDFDQKFLRRQKAFEVFDVPAFKFMPGYDEYVCDGSTIKFYQLEEKNPDRGGGPDITMSTLRPSTRAYFLMERFDYPVYLAHGSVLSAQQPELTPQAMRIDSFDPKLFQYLGRGNIGGVVCEILSAQKGGKKLIDYWVDTTKDSAVVQVDKFRDGDLYLRTAIQYQKIPWGWVPKSWTIGTYYYDAISFEDKLNVKSVQINPILDRKEFEGETRPGLIVKKVDEGKSYRISEHGVYEPLPTGERGGSYWLVVLVVVLAVIVLGYAAIRYRVLVWPRRS